MDVLTAAAARGLLEAAARRIIEEKPALTGLDSAIGDGDHGIGMARGMQKALDKIASQETDDVYGLFSAFGTAMLMSMGGASGVIFGSMFMAGAKGRPPAPRLTAGDFAEMMEQGLAAVKERGKAQPGDKTMVDALQPAVEAMKAASGGGFPAMLEAGAAAARAGAQATKGYVARFGRAKSLGERALGHMDAGAVSVSLILDAMYGCACGR